jgi:hypothetical protein
MWGALSDERTGLLFTVAAGPCQSSYSWSRVPAAGLVTILYCLRFEAPLTWRVRFPYLYPTGTDGPVITPGAGFPFRPLLRRGAKVEEFESPPRGVTASKVKVTLRLTVSQSSLGVEHHLRLMTRYLLLFNR